MTKNKDIRNREFTIKFNHWNPILILDLCEHTQIEGIVFERTVEETAQELVDSKEKCKTCGKGVK